MHYIEVYFCQQSKFGDSADSSNEYENLRENFRFPELRSSGSTGRCLYQNIPVVLLSFSWLRTRKPLQKFLISRVSEKVEELRS